MQHADPNALTRPWKAEELARAIGARPLGDSSITLTRIDVFERAGPESVTFIRSDTVARRWSQSRAGCAIITRALLTSAGEVNGEPRALLEVDDADEALSRLLALLAPPRSAPTPGVHPSAVVHPDSRIAGSASIGPLCVIEAGAHVGERTELVAQVYLGREARVGDDCTLHPGVRVLDRCRVGDACILHAGVVLGADGFGYRPAPDKRSLIKVPHIGIVSIGAHVEIGANTCIDRAKFGATTVGDGTKIDNLCQIGHNVTIGKCCIICGNCGIAGSVTLEDGVVLAGGVGVADNHTIGAGARVGAYSAVSTSLPAGGEYLGYPAGPAGDTKRTWARVRALGRSHGRKSRS